MTEPRGYLIRDERRHVPEIRLDLPMSFAVMLTLELAELANACDGDRRDPSTASSLTTEVARDLVRVWER